MSPPQTQLVAYESDEFSLWILQDNKYLYINDKFIGKLPFDLKYEAKSIFYYESFILICEAVNQCHIFELSEFFNIMNHQILSIKSLFECETNQNEIFEACIMNDVVYILSQKGIKRFFIYNDDEDSTSSAYGNFDSSPNLNQENFIIDNLNKILIKTHCSKI